MSSISTYSLTEQEMTGLVNDAKEALVKALANDGIISKDEARRIAGHYSIIAKPKGMLGRIWDKIAGEDNHEGIRLQVVKRCYYAILDQDEIKQEEEKKKNEA